MSVKWYFRRIRAALARLWRASTQTHPLNRQLMNDFLCADPFRFIQHLLSGFSGVDQVGDGDGWEANVRFGIFKTHIQHLEKDMAAVVRDRFQYEIEDVNTLDIILGQGRLEKVLQIPVPNLSSLFMSRRLS
jgi:hypothetical protein